MKDCTYRLPCGRCDKYDIVCDAPHDYSVKFNCNHNWLTKIVDTDYKDEHGNKYCVVHQACVYCGAYESRVQQIEPSLNI